MVHFLVLVETLFLFIGSNHVFILMHYNSALGHLPNEHDHGSIITDEG